MKLSTLAGVVAETAAAEPLAIALGALASLAQPDRRAVEASRAKAPIWAVLMKSPPGVSAVFGYAEIVERRVIFSDARYANISKVWSITAVSRQPNSGERSIAMAKAQELWP
jgi:hypothetical protein